MRTEERSEIKTVVNTVYIAEDGTEFLSERDCNNYEYAQEQKFYLEKLKVIEHAASGFPPTAGEEVNENNYFDWYRPKTNAELIALNEVYGGINLDIECLNKWVCIDHTEEIEEFGTDNYATQIDMSIDYVKRLFDKLGYDVEFTERSRGYE